MHRTLETYSGPNAYAVKQLQIRQKAETTATENDFRARIEVARAEGNLVHEGDLFRDRHNARTAMRRIHTDDVRDLREAQRLLIAQTGINPDAGAEARRAAVHAENNARAARVAALVIARRAENAALDAQVARLAGRAPGRALAAFVADPQNVHTTEAVRQTKDTVALVLQIPVPAEYRWHAINASKTPFEIGLECNLSQRAAWQMMSQYAQETAIYDIEPGIYGKVLDCVWQYTKTSADKADLCRIIRQELQDNIGMCAQGNLSRICNILAGYLEGVAPPESIADKLGRLLPPLAVIDDAYDRFIRAVAILKENNVPRDQWGPWLDALRLEDEDQSALDDVLVSS